MKKQVIRILLPFLVLASIVLCAMPKVCAAQTGESPTSQRESDTSGNYSIGKGDILEINVWREPMLSGETIVRNDGMISLALVGDVLAAGRTTMEVKDEIQTRLKQFLGEPVVTVMLRTAASQKFYVIGEVRTPGEYDLVKEMTVVQGIARAGGFTEWANKDGIVLLRKERGAENRIPVNYKDIVKGKNITQNVLLRANDTIVVP